jgi:ribosome-binding factor A
VSEDGRRALRVAGLVRARFAEAVKRELHDPRLSGLVVSDVQISDDLALVHIRVRFLGVEDATERRVLMTRLKRVLPRLRRSMLEKLELRRMPELRVHFDEGGDAAQRVDELLREIEEEKKKQ